MIWGGELESFLRREAYRGRGSLASAEGYSPYRWQGLLRRRGEGQGAWLERECQHNLANFAKRPNTAYVGLSDSVREAKGEGFAREVELARRDHHVLVYGDYRNRLVLRGLLRGGHELSSDYKAQMRSAVYARFLQAHARGRFLGELLGAAQSMVQEDDPATRVPEIPYKFYTDSYGNNMREVQMDPSVWALHHQDFEMRREVVALCQEIWPTYQVPSTLDDLEPGLDIAGLIAEEPGDDEVRAGIKRLAREFPNQTDDSELPEGIMQRWGRGQARGSIQPDRYGVHRKGARDWVLQHRMPAPLGGREWPDGTGIGIELQEWVCLMIHVRCTALCGGKYPTPRAPATDGRAPCRRGVPGGSGSMTFCGQSAGRGRF